MCLYASASSMTAGSHWSEWKLWEPPSQRLQCDVISVWPLPKCASPSMVHDLYLTVSICINSNKSISLWWSGHCSWVICKRIFFTFSNQFSYTATWWVPRTLSLWSRMLSQSPQPDIGWGNAESCSNRFFTVPYTIRSQIFWSYQFFPRVCLLNIVSTIPRTFSLTPPSPLHGILRWHTTFCDHFILEMSVMSILRPLPQKHFPSSLWHLSERCLLGVIDFQWQTLLKDGWNPSLSLQS